MKKALFVYNPKSGNKNLIQNLDYVVQRFQEKSIMMNFYRIGTTGEELKNLLINGKYDMAIFAGGDGTINYGANLILENNIDIPFGVIPAGTCNDFARCLGIEGDVESALDIILSGNIKRVDVGLLNDKQYFLSTFAGGLFAGVSFDTNSDLKKSLGPLAYYLKGISEVINIKSFVLDLETESEKVREKAVMFMIVNGKHAGGFKELVKSADLVDGYMDIIIIKKCYHVDLTKLFFKVLTSDFLDDKNIRVLKAKKCIIKDIPENISLTMDGEEWKKRDIKIEFLHQKLAVFAKKDLGEENGQNIKNI